MPVTLSEDEATKLGVLPSERLRYFKLVDAKSNLVVRSDDPTLYRLHSIELPNAEPPIYPLGDNFQAITRVQLPLQNSGMGSTDQEKIRQAILNVVDRGKEIDGRLYPYSPSAAGADTTRALLPDAIAAAQAATAPTAVLSWRPGGPSQARDKGPAEGRCFGIPSRTGSRPRRWQVSQATRAQS